MNMGGLESDLEDLYRRRHGAFQVMLASVTGSVESARDVVKEAFARRCAIRTDSGAGGHSRAGYCGSRFGSRSGRRGRESSL
jgi:hypothetical protein